VKDPRVRRYADLLLDTCLGVQPGWEVLVLGTPEGRPLLEEIAAGLGRRNAYAVFQLSFGGGIGSTESPWLREAPTELISNPASIQSHMLEHCDAIVAIVAPENTRESASVEARAYERRPCCVSACPAADALP
jgi:leucyl aminopeptidase (aminopeptidase T)